MGEPGALDQGIEIDSGRGAHFLAEQHQIFGGDIASGGLVARERAAPQTADRTVETGNAHLQADKYVRDTQAAGVVQVQGQLQFGPAATHLGHCALDRGRRCSAHGVAQIDGLVRNPALVPQGQQIAD